MNMQIDLSRLKSNADSIKKETGCKLISVIKADAYGHGAIECARALESYSDAFAVATIREALELSPVVDKDVIVLSQAYDGMDYARNIVFAAYDENGLNLLKKSGRRYIIKIDTGMNRLGFSCRQFSDLARQIDYKNVCGVFTHIFDRSAMQMQVEKFCALTDSLPVERHVYASCLTSANGNCFDYVRTGLLLYGYGAEYVKPVMSVYAKVLQVRKISKGENVGYGICRVGHDCIIATLDIGYADGFRRKREGEDRTVIIGGKKSKIIGQICMDMCMVEVDESVRSGDNALILGDALDAKALACEWGTTEYEVLTSLGKSRAERKYVN